jgi:hypothetical protein
MCRWQQLSHRTGHNPLGSWHRRFHLDWDGLDSICLITPAMHALALSWATPQESVLVNADCDGDPQSGVQLSDSRCDASISVPIGASTSDSAILP